MDEYTIEYILEAKRLSEKDGSNFSGQLPPEKKDYTQYEYKIKWENYPMSAATAEKIDSFLPTDTDPRSSLHFVDDFWAQADLQGFTHKEILPGTIIQLSGWILDLQKCSTLPYHGPGTTLPKAHSPASARPSQPAHKREKLNAKVQSLWTYLIEHWPDKEGQPDVLFEVRFSLTDCPAVWLLFKRHIPQYLSYCQNKGATQNFKIIGDLYSKLQKEVEECGVFDSHLLQGMYDSFIAAIDRVVAPMPGLEYALRMSDEARKALQASYRTGKALRKQAIEVPVPRYSDGPPTDHNMVENNLLLEQGIESGALKCDKVVCLDGYNRVLAPPPGKAYAIMFCEQQPSEGPKDYFGFVVYNAGDFSKAFGTSDKLTLAEQETVQHNIQFSFCLVLWNGVMVKSTGLQQVSGHRYQNLPSIEDSISSNLKIRTRIDHQKILHDQMKEYHALGQAKDFEFMRGLHAPFAKEQMAIATEYQLLNALGRPDTSSFATYGYGAGQHIDKDESVSFGYVTKRSSKVPRSESNFVWGDHKLIVELAEGARWIWRASQDRHGSTANSVALSNPDNWRTMCKKDPEACQWTRVSTIPRRVVMAK
ncbi:hypothetical protein PC9H_008967 [Pleurotus ostreatus]|uniref:Uncharacterized protein n=1 Tax=Pleurotus ostreatus TaxID=5322 RepID=A0A8H6ZQ02_PLEOS|nr:uncharacterized protein PC9H_008967 [Pleurotus ostreatus]KAF7426598.1 hypothetical protein PC9H_008967 [Pleurotus ostreatus]